jgi:hypothetical protein
MGQVLYDPILDLLREIKVAVVKLILTERQRQLANNAISAQYVNCCHKSQQPPESNVEN